MKLCKKLIFFSRKNGKEIKIKAQTHGSMKDNKNINFEYLKRSKIMLILVPIFIISILTTACSISLEMNEQNNLTQTQITQRPIIHNELDSEINTTENNSEQRIIHSVDINDIKSENVSLVMGVGEIIDIYSENSILSKLQLTEVMSGREVMISINNRRSQSLHFSENIQLDKNIIAKMDNIFFHENQNVAGVIINLREEKIESFPEYLIENRIGLNNYIKSRKIGNNTYEAIYDVSKARVIKGEKFARLYPDSTKLTEFDEKLIYYMPDEKKVSWVSFREGIEYVIEVENFTETMIRSYFWDYPSFLNSRTLCMKRINLKEDQSEFVIRNDDDLIIEINKISATNFDINITIESEISEEITNTKLAPGENIEHNNIIIILDSITIDQDLIAEICFA